MTKKRLSVENKSNAPKRQRNDEVGKLIKRISKFNLAYYSGKPEERPNSIDPEHIIRVAKIRREIRSLSPESLRKFLSAEVSDYSEDSRVEGMTGFYLIMEAVNVSNEPLILETLCAGNFEYPANLNVNVGPTNDTHPDKGMTLLFLAASIDLKHNTALTDKLVNATDFSRVDLNAGPTNNNHLERGMTTLHMAIGLTLVGRHALLNKLVEFSNFTQVDLNAAPSNDNHSEKGVTLFYLAMMAFFNGSKVLLDKLLERDFSHVKINVNAAPMNDDHPDKGVTVLYLVALKGDQALWNKLVEAGNFTDIDINAGPTNNRHPDKGMTLLYLASLSALNNKHELLNKLLTECNFANVNLNAAPMKDNHPYKTMALLRLVIELVNKEKPDLYNKLLESAEFSNDSNTFEMKYKTLFENAISLACSNKNYWLLDKFLTSFSIDFIKTLTNDQILSLLSNLLTNKFSPEAKEKLNKILGRSPSAPSNVNLQQDRQSSSQIPENDPIESTMLLPPPIPNSPNNVTKETSDEEDKLKKLMALLSELYIKNLNSLQVRAETLVELAQEIKAIINSISKQNLTSILNKKVSDYGVNNPEIAEIPCSYLLIFVLCYLTADNSIFTSFYENIAPFPPKFDLNAGPTADSNRNKGKTVIYEAAVLALQDKPELLKNLIKDCSFDHVDLIASPSSDMHPDKGKTMIYLAALLAFKKMPEFLNKLLISRVDFTVVDINMKPPNNTAITFEGVTLLYLAASLAYNDKPKLLEKLIQDCSFVNVEFSAGPLSDKITNKGLTVLILAINIALKKNKPALLDKLLTVCEFDVIRQHITYNMWEAFNSLSSTTHFSIEAQKKLNQIVRQRLPYLSVPKIQPPHPRMAEKAPIVPSVQPHPSVGMPNVQPLPSLGMPSALPLPPVRMPSVQPLPSLRSLMLTNSSTLFSQRKFSNDGDNNPSSGAISEDPYGPK